MTRNSDIYIPSDSFEKTAFQGIWTFKETDGGSRTELILPKGTIELIFNFSDPIFYINPYFDRRKILPSVFFNGLNSKPFQLHKTGHQYFLGIQMSTIGFRNLFRFPFTEMGDDVMDAFLLLPGLYDIWGKLYEQPDFNQQVKIIQAWILRQMEGLPAPRHVARIQAWVKIGSCNELNITRFRHEMSLSERQLRRWSLEWLGMCPERSILYLKYIKALHLLHQPEMSLTQIGLQAGYYDQSHFIREFRFFTDRTPGQYQQSNRGIPGHIYY